MFQKTSLLKCLGDISLCYILQYQNVYATEHSTYLIHQSLIFSFSGNFVFGFHFRHLLWHTLSFWGPLHDWCTHSLYCTMKPSFWHPPQLKENKQTAFNYVLQNFTFMGGQELVSHHRCPGSISGQSTWYLWWT